MTRDRQVVGFDRTLELAWLDATVGFVAEGLTPAQVRQRLFAYLEGVVPGTTNNSARGKTITVLTRIWSKVAPGALGLRNDAVRLYGEALPAERLALHWALTITAYPYFLDVATHTGRLLRLHGEMHVPQLTRRLGDAWGQRELVQRTAQLAARSMALWGVLRHGGRPGVYLPAGRTLDVPGACAALLAEALLMAGSREALPTTDIVTHPALFPFAFQLNVADVHTSPRLDVHRTGLDTELVGRRWESSVHGAASMREGPGPR